MYLVTKLNKRTKTISWFLIHVFVLQLVPFSLFAHAEKQSVSFSPVLEKKSDRVNIARAILASATAIPSENSNSESSAKAHQLLQKKENRLKLTTVSSSGGGFSPGSMNDMVDPFTGDFSYSIPLMDVEGYPLTLNYNSNVTMNSEATWVGLGWNLDVGSVSREMRGIPDEFNGDQSITSTYKVKKDETNDGFKGGGYVAVSTSFGIAEKLKNIKLSPKIQVTALWGKYTNSYLGLGKTFDIGLQAATSLSYSNEIGNIGPSLKFGLGYSSDTKGGVGFNKSFGITAEYGPKSGKTGPFAEVGMTFGNNFNSRSGLVAKTQSFNVAAGYVQSPYKEDTRDPDTKKLLERGNGGSTFGAAYGASTSVTYGTAAAPAKLRRSTYSESDAFMTDLYFGFSTGVKVKIGAILESYMTSTDFSGVTSSINQPAYGYMHSGKRIEERKALAVMDFDRGTEFGFSENMKNLPFSIQSFDIFHVSSSGLNAQFRANRSDVGTFYDAHVQGELNNDSKLLINDDIKGVNAGVILGAGVTVEVGYSTGVQKGTTESGGWQSWVNFDPVPSGPKYDPTVYFKAIGEVTPNDPTNYNTFGGAAEHYFPIDKSGSDLNISSTLSNGTSVSQSSIVNSIPVRATAFIPMTVSEMMNSSISYDHDIKFYPTTTATTTSSELRNSGVRANNHISAVKVVSTSGGIYTYGLPNYSLLSSDVSFSVSNTGGRTYDETRGEVKYFTGDDETSNSLGKAHMLDRTDIPAYASSFMLTSIVGSDYVDLTNDGPSTDDVGSYHQFDYVRLYDRTNPYKWRFPVSGLSGGDPKAILNKGYLSLSSDDIATYSYSEREVYYPKSVSGKNYIAVFVLQDRQDAYSVSDKNGFLATGKPLKYLEKIILYNLNDYKQNPATATPLQVIEFEYDYSLCLNAPNNPATYNTPGSSNSGKLTLKSIKGYSGTSKEMGLSKTVFTYNDGPAYNHLNTDRWGNYKENDSNLPNNLYPYAVQNETVANQNARFWKLSKITTPTGGEMTISYESDSYGFVQNERAMRHFQIAGMMNLAQYYAIMTGSSWSTADLSAEFRNDSYDPGSLDLNKEFSGKYGSLEKNFVPNNIMVFKLDQAIDGSLAKTVADKKVKNDYFKQASGSNNYLTQLYFNVYAEVKSGYQEMIPCFVKIMEDFPGLFNATGSNLVSIGVLPKIGSSTVYEYGYVVLDLMNIGKTETTKKKKKDKDILIMHPIQQYATDFIRQNLPDIVYGACESCTGELSVDKKALFGKEMYKYLIAQGGYLRSLDPARSFVRLYEPDNKKMGGNARVSSIQLNDKWGNLSGEGTLSDGTYGWQYLYPSRSSSLGVAAYEPSAGMDENPFYGWDTYYNIAKKFPDEMNFNVTPVAMQLFPNPVVGYEQVRIQMSGIAESTKGAVVYNFHTNKELKYRTVAKSTPIDLSDPVKEKKLLSGSTVNKYGFSQGYSVITNDFHGKPIDVTLVDGNENPISRSEYEYYELGEPVPMIDRKGMVQNEQVAQEYDIHMDSRLVYNESKFQMAGLTLGFTFPTFKVSISPSYSQTSSKRGFYSHCLIKHMNYSAVVKSIKTTYLGSLNTAKNELYDRYSGAVVLSSLQDEYNDRLYNLAYPSHWAYPALREIQATAPISNTGTITGSGLLTTTFDLGESYTPGDLVEFTNGTTTANGYILSINPTATGATAYIILESGAAMNTFSGSVTFSLKKANRNNRLEETMQSIVTKTPFSITSGTALAFPSNPTTDKIISGSAIKYKDKDNIMVCSTKPEGAYINLFNSGAKGDPVIETAFSWQSERRQEVDPNRTRFDGSYLDFKPFYALNANHVWVSIDHATYPLSGNGTLQKWRKSEIPTRFNETGILTESRDPLGIFSSQMLINNKLVSGLPVAQVVNANLTDAAFDGFETYSYNGVASNGYFFKFEITNTNLFSNTVRHSGKSSLKLSPAQYVQYMVTTRNNCPIEEVQSTDVPGRYIDGSSCNCPPPAFNPNPGDYVVGAWVKQSGTGATVNVIIGSGTSASTVTCANVGPVIEGWQRVEAICPIPQGPVLLTLKLDNGSSDVAYFDDFRIHPFTAAMSTVVYDPVTLLPLATHDGNNYTTFYNYDENLQLVRVKVETIEGIKTVSETESGLSTK